MKMALETEGTLPMLRRRWEGLLNRPRWLSGNEDGSSRASVEHTFLETGLCDVELRPPQSPLCPVV